MNLYYFKEEIGNFGDDLNPWLWPKIMPAVLDDDEQELFVGIGTLLNHRLPVGVVKHIFGSGYGYGRLPVVDSTWKVVCLRGPLTAKALGLDPGLAVTDSALLIRNVCTPNPTQAGPVGLIPHYHSVRLADWQNLAEDAGLRYISPEWPVEAVLEAIKGCRAVLCEAMHGAIAADALRVPWKAVTLNLDLFELKWQDWLSTVELPFEPLPIGMVFNAERSQSFLEKRKNDIKRLAMHLPGLDLTPPPPRASGARVRSRAVAELRAAAVSPGFRLSSDDVQDRLLARLNNLVAEFSSRHHRP